MAKEVLIGETVLSKGGTTIVPEKVLQALNLTPEPGERSKLLWTPTRDEVAVTKGTPQSDWRKTMLRKNGTTAIPRHVQQALRLTPGSRDEERVQWVGRGARIVVRKRTRA